jgi:DNA-binding transcriptional MocR family regulator
MNVSARYRIRGRSASEVARSVESAVREGALAPGDALPPVRALAAALGMSAATVAAAYRQLRARGIAAGAGRLGTRVTARPPVLEAPAPPAPRGLRDLASGNPDPKLFPPIRAHLPRIASAARLYGGPADLPELLRVAAHDFERDGIPARHLAVVGGALDGVERVLQAHLRPGDPIAVEDPGYTGVLDLVPALGLVPRGVAVDESGPQPASLEAALRAGARAFVVTPRAQNPTGAALDPARVRELRRVLAAYPDALVVEDDHAGAIAGARAETLSSPERAHWAVVRSVSKSLGPDLRVAALTADEVTLARVRARRSVGAGWVSHLLQALVARMWADPATARRLAAAEKAYAERRRALEDALRGKGIAATARSGLNVWIPVREEASAVAHMAARGWAIRAGERYRLRSPPAVRVTVATLDPAEAPRVAADLAESLRGGGRRPAA